LSNLDESKDLPGFAARDGKEPEEQDDDFNVPFADDSEDEQAPAGGVPKLDDSTLQLSQEGGTAASASNTINNSTLSGLDDSPSSKRSREEVKPRKKRRKRRKVVIDNHNTELTNEQIRNMLSDTADLVRKMVHPASWEGEDSNSSFTWKQQHGEKGLPPILTQPFLADEGDHGGPRLHPRLRKLWEDNYWRALGNPCPYRTKASQEDEDDDSVEQVRRNQEVDEEDDDQSDQEVPVTDADISEKCKAEDFDVPQMDDEEEDEPADAPVVDSDEEEELVKAEDDVDDLNLGLVNDMAMDSDDEDEDRQTLGDVPEATAKWHKHTVRVYKHLKKCMRDPSASVENDEEDHDLPPQVQFFDIIKNVKTRHNAATVFFEILQLKTWDFIEVDQNDPFGDITISPSVRFGEDPPN
jgi:hypothetical protein